jgi:hypothetical protein
MSENLHGLGKFGCSVRATVILCAAIIMGLVSPGLLSVANAQPKSFATDDRGFINTAARCEKPKFAVAMGRTQRSLVAICVDGRGHYEYHGLRLSDDSVLNVPARAMADGKFIVVNAGFTYTFSPKELVIAQGARVIRKEPMVAYVEPRPVTEESSSAPN